MKGEDIVATKGRKPKPTAMKMLEGNPGKRPLNLKEPVPEKKLPKCPDWLEDCNVPELIRMVLERMIVISKTEFEVRFLDGTVQKVCVGEE